MSLIRYSSDDTRSVVLRHQHTLVLYDPHSRQIILREASPTSPAETSQSCPYCKRPMHHGEEPATDPLGPSLGHRSRSNTPLAESGFVDQQYFRMLESSIPIEGELRRSIPLPRLDTLDSEDEVHSEDEVSCLPQDTGIKASAFSPGYFERFFVMEKELGKGGKGIVLLVRHVLDGVSLGKFACKRVPVGNNHEWLEKVLIEVQLLQKLSHPNLVSYRHVWLENAQLSNFGPTVPCAFILQQACHWCSCLQRNLLNHWPYQLLQFWRSSPLCVRFCKATNQRVAERSASAEVSRAARFTTTALQPSTTTFQADHLFLPRHCPWLNHLHSNGFIHRDLKPSNCLLHDTGIPGEQFKVLVSDFGEVQSQNEARKSTGNTGTISYCAPEVLKRVSPSGAYENFTTKSDIFSLGMILHFMCFGKLPYVGADQINEENEDLDALREEISAWQGLSDEEKIRTDLPERLYHSLQTLIHPDPNVRPTAEDILLGIEMGIGEESPPMAGSIGGQKGVCEMDESQALGFRRISPVADSPRSVTPVDPLASKLHPEYSTFKSNGKPTTEHRKAPSTISKKTPKKTSKLCQSSEPPASPPLAPASATVNESSMILRPRVNPGVPEAALEALPAGFSWRDKMFANYMILKIIVFFVKVVSLSQPCMPAAPKSSVYYPILGLAILDFTAPPLTLTIVLGVTHVVLLFLVRISVGLCVY
ncbi:kinase-like domain-containing protein [Trichophaea hybrida]|nr:kinase-like domain-containing protein [Trichophaea hybrida]KAF8542513.1 kinase-like domain-containing protein [Trichophaea hybrida]